MQLMQCLQMRQILTIDYKITPLAICPDCKYVLDEDEIKDGWSDSPTDYNTTCPKCKHRFLSVLVLQAKNKKRREVIYLCLIQVNEKIKKMIKAGVDLDNEPFVARYYPSVFWSIVRHFGTFEGGLNEHKI